VTTPKITAVSCHCGNVRYEAIGAPIMGVVCYCDDCQKAACQIEALPGALPLKDPAGGTQYILYRKDRFKCVMGETFLQDFRIREKSPTRRVIASCCNSPMFMDFEKGHWFSVYRARFTQDAPPLQIRIQTRFKLKDTEVPSDLPIYASFPLTFMVKLIGAKIAMLLRL